MGRGRILAIGALIGLVAVAFSGNLTGNLAGDIAVVFGGVLGGTALVYLFARARGWTK